MMPLIADPLTLGVIAFLGVAYCAYAIIWRATALPHDAYERLINDLYRPSLSQMTAPA